VAVLNAAALNVAALNAAARTRFLSPKRTFSHWNHSGFKGTLPPSGPGGFVPEIRGFCKFFLLVDSG
jgi:hypothetical protein